MHPEISMCLRLLARLNYIMGDYQEALFTQHKAVMMSERVLGIDHPQTATEYVSIQIKATRNSTVISDSTMEYIYIYSRPRNGPGRASGPMKFFS
jgi:protein TIF31